MTRIASLTLAASLLLVAACSGSQHSVAPVPVLPQSASRSAINAVSAGELGNDAMVGPYVSVTVSVVITVPSGSNAQSVAIRVNGGTAVVSNITSGSPGCGGTPLACTISVTAPTGSDVFGFKTFSGTNGSGSVLATGNVFQKITVSSFTVRITLGGTPAAIVLALKQVSPRECDPAMAASLYVMVMDSSANTIIGSYGEPVALSDSDASGKTSLSPTSLSTSSTSITIRYNGFPLGSATFSASANGVPGGSVTKAMLKPQQMIYIPGYDHAIGGYAVLVFPSSANGNVAPARTISGGAIGFNNVVPSGVALDGSCDLFVLEPQAPITTFAPYPSQVDVFNAGANGHVAPIRSFHNFGNGLDPALYSPTSISLDGSGNAWIATAYIAGSQPPTIQEYSANASGNVAPLAVIDGPNTGLIVPSVAIGPSNKIYSSQGGDVSNNVLVFAAGSNGNVAPSQTISANSNATVVGVDSAGEIYVGDGSNNDIQIYAANATGNTPPVATISGSNTSLSVPACMAFGYGNNLFVCNNGGGSILQFVSGSNGNVAPHTSISGSNTLLGPPFGGLSL